MMEIKPYQLGDEEHILSLFKISFGKALPQKYWKWRFEEHPEKKMMIMLMWDGEHLVGHYAVSPVRMLIEKEEVLTALSMTTMTHPEYAGRGIFTELAEALYSEQKTENNLAAVWGYPNNNSHYGFIKNVQWKNLEQVPTFSIDTKLIEETENQIQVGSGFGPRHAVGDSNVNFTVQIKRDAAYLNWRYATNPVNEYVLFESEHEGEMHFVVAKKFASFQEAEKYEVDIMEWEVPADIMLQKRFLSSIKKHFASHELCRFNMWMPLDDPRHIQLEKIGFRNLAPITYSGIRLLNPQYARMLTSGNWHYNLGYSDIY
jgi:GNAT superfamily N-acetyltransferase